MSVVMSVPVVGQAPMLGRCTPVGPGGRRCVCCHTAPGPARTRQRRSTKRVERQSWKREYVR